MVLQKLLVEEGVKRGLKQSRDYSVSVLGYDFIGLVGRLMVFFLASFMINAYFVATIQGGIWLNALGTFFNMKFPTTLPDYLTQLFTTGYKGVTFWNIVTTISILLVVIEAMQYDKMLKQKDEKPNITTLAVFGVLALGLSLITFPELINKMRERRIIFND